MFEPLLTARQSSWFWTYALLIVISLLSPTSKASVLCPRVLPLLPRLSPAELSMLMRSSTRPLQFEMLNMWTGALRMFSPSMREEMSLRRKNFGFSMFRPELPPILSQYACPLPLSWEPGAPMMRTFVPVIETSGFERPGLPDGAKEVLPSKVTYFLTGSVGDKEHEREERRTVAPALRFKSIEPPTGTLSERMMMLEQAIAPLSWEYEVTVHPTPCAFTTGIKPIAAATAAAKM